MQIAYFTKFLKGLSVEEIGQTANRFKFDGLDLAIRAGHAVNPDNVKSALPKAMDTWRKMDLSVPMVTLETRWVDPAQPGMEAVYEACGKACIPYIKLGYWRWQPGDPYGKRVEAIRTALAQFAELGKKHGVCSLVHTHSGAMYGCNAGGTLALIQGFDPCVIGAYLDPAHLAVNGEPLPMALDILAGYLKVVAVKNVRHLPVFTGEGPHWKPDWCLLSEGLVNWGEVVKLLRQAGFDGPLSVHGEYSASEVRDEVLRLVAQDVEYLRTRV